LIPAPMMAWLSHGKKWKDKEKGTVSGPSHLRKYHDAVVKGAAYSGGLHLSKTHP